MNLRNFTGAAAGLLAAAGLALGTTSGAQEAVPAALRLPAMFGDHMVLQRDLPLPVWGWAAPGESVRVTAGAVSADAKADAAGRWRTTLGRLPASAVPIAVTVETPSKTVTLNDVLVGDVWICSGQSNMAFGLGNTANAAEELARADRPSLRLFKVKVLSAAVPQEDCSGEWQVCSAATARRFSAVGYFFGRDISESQRVPVGLIDSSLGGTPAQSWTDLPALKADPDLDKTYLQPVAAILADPAAAKASHDQWLAAGGEAYRAALRQHQTERYQALQKNLPVPPAPPRPAAPEPLTSEDGARYPAGLFNGMIAPLAPLAIKGVAWYQGEANATGAALYGRLLKALIESWRARWGQGDFAFFIVQLPNFGKRGEAPDAGMGGWPMVREQQRWVAAHVPNTGIAVTIDAGQGNDLHPRFKSEVGRRLALAVREKVYGEAILGTSPVPRSCTIEAGKVLVRFDHAGDGLRIGAPPEGSMTPAPAADGVRGFAVAGRDGKYAWARAVIEGPDTVAVSSDAVPNPATVRYGWGADPEVNLYNSAGLPASPFHADVAAPR